MTKRTTIIAAIAGAVLGYAACAFSDGRSNAPFGDPYVEADAANELCARGYAVYRPDGRLQCFVAKATPAGP